MLFSESTVIPSASPLPKAFASLFDIERPKPQPEAFKAALFLISIFVKF